MPKTPPHSLDGSAGQCGSNDVPHPPLIEPEPSPEQQNIPSPDLLIDNEIPRSPTLTLPEDFKFPDLPVVPQNRAAENSASSSRHEELSKLSALEICKYHSALYLKSIA
ncbi:hypothetical protein Bca4012_063207 [Brassica carinata]